jgi:Ca-activated chloride channel homolog
MPESGPGQLALLMLLILICPLQTVHAQSGRARGATGAEKVNRGNQSETTGEGSSGEAGTNGQGEVIEGDVLKVETTLVTVPVSVRDRQGRYIPDLGREDFHILENGVEQKIAYFATVDQPFTVALVLDTSNSTNFRLEDIQSAAITFVNQLKAEDRVMVISFDDHINVMIEPTSDRAALTRAIRRTRTGGGTRLYDAVEFVLRKKLKQIEGRKAMVLFTDGVDTESRNAGYDGTLRLAAEQDALVYPVSYDTNNGLSTAGGGQRIPLPGGRGGIIIGTPFPRIPVPSGGGIPGGGGDPDYRRAGEYLRALALNTGGRFYNGDTLAGISQAFAEVAEELRRQYSLGYYPKTAGVAAERRQIKVRVNQPHLVVTARDSYIYSTNKAGGAPETDKGKPQKLTTQTSPSPREKYRPTIKIVMPSPNSIYTSTTGLEYHTVG